MTELININTETRSIKEVTEVFKAMIRAIRNREQIAIVCSVNNNFRTLRNIAELLFLETEIEIKNHLGYPNIKYFDSSRKGEDVFAFFSQYIHERSCCIIWEEAQSFTPEVWSNAIYKTDDLKFKSIFLVDSSTESLFSIPSFVKNSVRIFCFSQLGILILRDILKSRLRIERYGVNLIRDNLYRYGILDKPVRLTFNTRITPKEENNMKIIGVYSNEKNGRTTIKFADGRVVSVQCDKEDKFDAHKGIAMALAKAAFGSKVLQECLSSYSEQKSGEENKKAKKARKAKAEAKKAKAKAKQENNTKEGK